MVKKSEFHAVDFFRKVRDEQADALADRTPAEVIAFFSAAGAMLAHPVRRPVGAIRKRTSSARSRP